MISITILLTTLYLVTVILWCFRCMSFLDENSKNVLEFLELISFIIYSIPIIIVISIIYLFISKPNSTFERFKKNNWI